MGSTNIAAGLTGAGSFSVRLRPHRLDGGRTHAIAGSLQGRVESFFDDGSNCEGFSNFDQYERRYGAERSAVLLTAVARGAKGILLKEAALPELVQCIRLVAAGDLWLPPDVEAALERGARCQSVSKRMCGHSHAVSSKSY
jgi:hypothetical protein